jgi:FSR family fosmidomycin resistance protein-like MFS transporter
MRQVLTPRLILVSLGHFTIDSYSSFFSPLLPLLVTKLHLSLTLVGTLVACAALSSSFAQPLFGFFADRVQRPWFVAFGPLVAAVFLSAIGLAPSYGALVALLMLGGIGVAAFHPQAAVIASELTPRRSIAMSVFVTGGTLGFSLGPLFAVSVVGAVGLDHTWVALFPGLVMSALLLAWFTRVAPRARHAGAVPAFSELRPVARPLSLLYFAVVARSAVSYGFMTFPAAASPSARLRGVGGRLAAHRLSRARRDRWIPRRLARGPLGRRRVVIASFLLATPLYFAFLYLPDVPGLVTLIAGSFALQSSLPVNVVLGQELSPRHSSTISSLLMGAAWGVGALLIGPIGALADHFGLTAALTTLACILLVGLACATALPRTRPAPAVALADTPIPGGDEGLRAMP